MNLGNEQIIEKSGYTLHVIPTEKYKTNTLMWRMKAPLDAESVTSRALLPYVLQSNTKNYPSTGEFRSYLDDLYGASFYVNLSKKGEFHVIDFILEIANEKYLQDKNPLLQRAMELFREVLLNPNVTNDAFDARTMEKEKRNLKQRIQAVFDDKMRYASVRLVQEMCKGEPYELPQHGLIEKVDEITNESLYHYYKKAFAEDEMDFYIIGDVDVTDVENYCSSFQFENRPNTKVTSRNSNQIREIKEIKETQDLKQGKLNLGCRTNITYGDPDYFALQMFNGIFGGFPHSKLFVNVREKESLAYYAASRVESHKGLLMIMSGIDNQNYDKAVSIIKEQLESMRQGSFTDQDIDQTKAVLKNQFLETNDSARGLIELLYHNIVADSNVSLQDWIDKINSTTKEEIVSVANKVELDTIYFLAGKGGDQ
ncbi:MAG TPA: pitrilysin family protein [Bacillaceae bacterium]|nr:pitrilysin family protein [Bacillaceae bacterium]